MTEAEIRANMIKILMLESLKFEAHNLLAEDASLDEAKERISYILRLHVAMINGPIIEDATNQIIEEIAKLKTSRKGE